MKINRQRIVQIVSFLVIQSITLFLLQKLFPGLIIDSIASAMGVAFAFSVIIIIFWLIFIQFFAYLPVILYPVLTFALSGAAILISGSLIPGIRIEGIGTGFWIIAVMTLVNSFLGFLLSIDEGTVFDKFVTARMVKKFGKPTKTDVPGFLFLEIDGLSEDELHRAMSKGYMPTLKRWVDRKTHTITGWETDFTSQTGAMQTGILIGNNDDIPAFRWWDRLTQKLVMSGDPRDAIVLEADRTTGRGLLAADGASRGNMFSGDAAESLFTISTVLNRKRNRGPGFYFFLFNPFVVVRLISRYVLEVFKELFESWQQKRRNDKYMIKSRGFLYAFFRAFVGPFIQDLSTLAVIGDVLRGVPAIYALYAGYDDLGHFAGFTTPECYRALHEVDRHFARIERSLAYAPRSYHVIVLSDHGQSLGPTFEAGYGTKLETLVDALIAGEGDVYAALGTDETWEKLRVILTESIQDDNRTAKILRGALRSRIRDDVVEMSPMEERDELARKKKAVVLSSGSAGLIYFPGITKRLTYEEIQSAYPDLIVGLVQHPGIGFVVVNSEENGPMVIGKKGFYFLKDDKTEGENPLEVYGPNAPRHLKRQNGFTNCPDILVNTTYNPVTQELAGFEEQVGHHGGIGGLQNKAFVMHPVGLSAGKEPIVTAVGLHNVMRSWRDQVQSADQKD
jgi:putative membrane protein